MNEKLIKDFVIIACGFFILIASILETPRTALNTDIWWAVAIIYIGISLK